jgi:hypothetical protein
MEVDEGFVARRPGNSGLEFWLLGHGIWHGIVTLLYNSSLLLRNFNFVVRMNVMNQ